MYVLSCCAAVAFRLNGGKLSCDEGPVSLRCQSVFHRGFHDTRRTGSETYKISSDAILIVVVVSNVVMAI